MFAISSFVFHKDITMATRMTNKSLLPMDLSGSASQVAEKWQKWKRAFEYYAARKGIDNAHKRTSELLHFAAMEVQDILEDLQDPGPIPEKGDNAFKIPIHTVDSYFCVKENIPYEHHVFRQFAPENEETADKVHWFVLGSSKYSLQEGKYSTQYHGGCLQLLYLFPLCLKMIKMKLSSQITKTSFLNMEFEDLEVLGVKYFSDRKCLIG